LSSPSEHRGEITTPAATTLLRAIGGFVPFAGTIRAWADDGLVPNAVQWVRGSSRDRIAEQPLAPRAPILVVDHPVIDLEAAPALVDAGYLLITHRCAVPEHTTRVIRLEAGRVVSVDTDWWERRGPYAVGCARAGPPPGAQCYLPEGSLVYSRTAF
jgi:hypothetical protein